MANKGGAGVKPDFNYVAQDQIWYYAHFRKIQLTCFVSILYFKSAECTSESYARPNKPDNLKAF